MRDQKSLLLFNVHGNLWSHRWFARLYYRFIKGRNLNALSPRAAIALARRHGLRVVRWSGFGVVPKPFYRIFGSRSMYAVDLFVSRIPGTRWISADLLFVCERENTDTKREPNAKS